MWPPLGIIPINPAYLPLFNTILLVSSGVSVVHSHKSIMRVDGRDDVTYSLIYAIILGVSFTVCQLYEYSVAEFSINDGIYGSIFYVSTGFHGLHVIIGTTALIVCLVRHLLYHFLRDHHIGLELTFWYWHFVDIIWILLYLFMYIGSWDFGYREEEPALIAQSGRSFGSRIKYII
jgi:cytochrome c oxidase subunit 3